jgi:hypothetical protein
LRGDRPIRLKAKPKRFKPLVDAKRHAFHFTVNFKPQQPVQNDRNSLLKVGAGNRLAQLSSLFRRRLSWGREFLY